jgi:hypothetical protein
MENRGFFNKIAHKCVDALGVVIEGKPNFAQIFIFH